MARSHAKIMAAIWDDEDFVTLNSGPQRLYKLLLTQRKLTLVGLLTYTPSRWARLAADTTLASVEGDIDELEASAFVIVDRDTDELLIRTFVKNDAANGRLLDNVNLLRGVWNAWTAIESRQLRLVAVENVPASVWDSPKATPPTQALELRAHLLQTPSSDPLERPVITTRSDQPLERAVGTSLRPSPFALPGEEFSKQAEALVESPRPDSAAAVDKSILDQALDLLTQRELERNPSHTNPERHRDATLRGKRRELASTAHRLLHLNPGLTARGLADLLEPPPANGNGRHPEPPRVTADGVPFIPGIGEATGPTELGEEPDPDTFRAKFDGAYAALRQATGDQP